MDTTTGSQGLKEPLATTHQRFIEAEENWGDSLRTAFGKNAADRRYDWDQSGHPNSCRQLYAEPTANIAWPTAMRDTPAAHRIAFLLGLPTLADNALWQTARRLEAPVLISANALSRWTRDVLGLRLWAGFENRNLHLVREHPVWLDSGGFVAAANYNGFPWTTEAYLDLAAAAPWQGFFSQDWCVEPEITNDEDAVLDRISGTVRLNVLCRNGAERRGIQDRFVPVIQGWSAHHYLRCVDRLPMVLNHPLVGVGSMCRRHVEGDHGVLRIVDELDRAFAGTQVMLHLFGLKSQAMAELRGHPRIASCDNQAYGVQARQEAYRQRRPKTNALLAAYMADWLRQQNEHASAPGYAFQAPSTPLPETQSPLLDPIEARIAAAAERLRDLHERGEVEWTDVHPLAAYEMALMDD